MDENEKSALRRLIGALRLFNQIDPRMQVSTILTLLEVAASEGEQSGLSVKDIEKRVGLMSGTSSRNVHYWAEGHKEMKGGHKLLDVVMHSEDHRRRSLRLTELGEKFAQRLLETMREH